MAINKTTTETKNKIKANSVIALPNRPQIPAEQLKKAFVKPIVDTSNSMIQELDRIVEETNAELEQVQVDITDAIDEHNTSNEAHEDIRQSISEHDFRINELEDFASNLETDITEEIENAVADKADLVDGKVPREQLPSYSYDEIIDKPVSVIFEITSFTELTPLQKTTITNQLMPLLNDNLTDLDTKKYSDLILRYLDERYHYSSVAVIDGEVVRILFDYKNEDTKIKLDINFVGDDSQTVIELVTINYEPEGTVSTHNTSETAHSDIRQKVDEAKAIAEGKSRARVFATKSALDTWLLNSENVALLQIGDNFYIEENDKPDYWWNGTTIKELETQKVDLTEYAKKTELLTLGTTSNDAYRGDLGQTAYEHSQSAHAPSNAQKNSDITKAEIEAKLTGEISSHSHALPTHNHDDRYYTETEVDTKLSDKANATHNHTKSEITDFPTSMTPTAHNHTKSEITDFPTIPTIPDLELNDNTETSGKYISKIEVDGTNKHKLNITKKDLPQGFSGDYNDLTNKPTIPTLKPTIELEVASLTTLTEAEKLAIRNTLDALIVDDKIDGSKFDDIVLVTTSDLIRLHYSSIDYYVANPQITVIFETQSTKYILNIVVGDYTYSTLTSTTTTIPTISTSITTDATDDTKTASPKAVKDYVDSAILGLLGGEY